LFRNDAGVGDKKQRDRDDDENNVENTSGYAKSGIGLSRMGWKDLVSVILLTG
jgi:hypothetical protein